MAKKKVETPVYPVAPLKITKEKFCGLLTEQIKKGNELYRIDVPQNTQSNPYYEYGGGFFSAGRTSDKVEYDETSENAFVADYKRWRDRCKSIYQTSFTEPESSYFHDFESQIWSIWGSDTVKEYKGNIQRLVNHMQGDIERVDLIECIAEEDTTTTETINTVIDMNKVFVVYGHNDALRVEVSRTIEQLGLRPIVLQEQEDFGNTIIEKFEAHASDIGFAVVLLTADDLGVSCKDLAREEKEKGFKAEYKTRARQNVVFEMGYFIGKLDRAHVFELLEDGVEKPGDLDGILYTSIDEEGMWKIRLAKRLKALGYIVNLDKII